MSLWSTINNGLDVAKVCMSGLELIQEIIKKRPGTDTEMLKLIGTIVGNLRDAVSGSKKPIDVMSDITKLRNDISANNAAADAAVDDKFPKD